MKLGPLLCLYKLKIYFFALSYELFKTATNGRLLNCPFFTILDRTALAFLSRLCGECLTGTLEIMFRLNSGSFDK